MVEIPPIPEFSSPLRTSNVDPIQPVGTVPATANKPYVDLIWEYPAEFAIVDGPVNPAETASGHPIAGANALAVDRHWAGRAQLDAAEINNKAY